MTEDLGWSGVPFNPQSDTDTIVVTVFSVNDTPTTSGISDVRVLEDAPNTVFSLYPLFDDVEDTDAQLIFTVENNTNEGQFTSVDISDPTSFTLDYAPGVNGVADITIRATDTGTPGLWVEDTFRVTVNAVNDGAPVLDPSGAMSLESIDEDDTVNSGTLVQTIIASAEPPDRITDVDGDLEGIAVMGVDETNGTWWFRISSGGPWTSLAGVSDTNATVLYADADTGIRFVPNADYSGTVDPGITFRAWDRTGGLIEGTTGVDITGPGGLGAGGTTPLQHCCRNGLHHRRPDKR